MWGHKLLLRVYKDKDRHKIDKFHICMTLPVTMYSSHYSFLPIKATKELCDLYTLILNLVLESRLDISLGKV